jgi:hypothetical protein
MLFACDTAAGFNQGLVETLAAQLIRCLDRHVRFQTYIHTVHIPSGDIHSAIHSPRDRTLVA